MVVLRSELISLARQHLSLSEDCVKEVETFIPMVQVRLEANQGGLQSFLQVLQREQLKLRGTLQDITAVETRKTSTAEKYLDHGITAIRHQIFQWETLKRGQRFMAVSQTVQSLSREERKRIVRSSEVTPREKQALHQRLKSESKVDVDVLDWGMEWLCIRWVQQNRLARQMTDSGWCWGYTRGETVDEAEWKDTPLAKHVSKLVGATKLNRCEYRIPRIRLVLPNIDTTNEDILVFLDHIKELGPDITIETGDGPFLTAQPPPLMQALEHLVGDEMENLTDTVNLDHTILVDMISDLTHTHLTPQPWQSLSTRQQIEEERSHDGLMAKTLYPLLRGKKLVCTKEAAAHLHEMLKTVGTEAEKRRGQLLVPLQPGKNTREEFASLSIYSLPDDLQIPVTVVEKDWTLPSIETAVEDGILPPVARDVAQSGFTESKRSIFLYGWAAGITTLTSNREIRGQIKTLVEANRHSEDEVGPSIWKVNTTRNLLSTGAAPRENGASS